MNTGRPPCRSSGASIYILKYSACDARIMLHILQTAIHQNI
jgi:hypothetical protein